MAGALGQVPVHEHGHFQTGQFVPVGEDLVQLRAVGAEHPAGLAVPEDEGGLGGIQGRVDGDVRQALDGAGEIGDGPFWPVLGHDRHAVPGLQSPGGHGQGQTFHLGHDLGVGEGHIDTIPPGCQGVRQVALRGRIEKLGNGFDGLRHNDSGRSGM